MARTSEDGFTTTIRDAIDLDGSFYPHVKAEIYPSRVYFETITSNHAVSGADDLGIQIDPMRQDIEYNATPGGLVTFYVNGSTLYYAVQGSSTGYTLDVSSSVKPGVLGSKLYAYVGSDIRRYSINWSGISVSYDSVYITPTHSVDTVHAISATEAIGIMEDEGGFRPVYMSGSSSSECTSRFMFHCAIKPTPKTDEEIREGKTDDTRTMVQKAIHSGAARLGTKIFVYMSNAQSGMIEGVYYDTSTSRWSNIFTVLPTDLQVSLCEFRIANAYTHNDTIYICGLFNRTDSLEGAEPYSLLLFSQNGKTFSINRNTLVSNIGYRFLARVGGDNLYLGNCNRVCYTPVTWVFDGASGTGVVVNISEDNIKAYLDSDLSRCGNLSLRSGLEQYFPENAPQVVEGARLIMYVGMQTTSTIEYVKYATYIIDGISYDIGINKRGMNLTATNEALWNLTGLSMPFYAEILGKSCCFDPMQQDVSMLSAVGNGCIAANSFQVDFWNHEGYTNTGLGITPIDLNVQGGVDYHIADIDHWFGIIMREEVQYKLALNDNPVITATTVHAKAYGWSACPNSGDSNDHIHILMQVTDNEGVDHDYVSTGSLHWKQTWADDVAGTDPVEFDFTAAYYGFEVGWKIKKVGLSFYSADETWFYPARVEFTSGVRAFYPLYGADTPWETNENWGYYKLPKAGKPFIMIATGPYNAFNFSLAARFKNTVDDLSGYGAYTGLVGHCQDGLNYTVGRYDKRTGDAQITICRDGVEQAPLAYDHVDFDVIDTDDTLQMRFDHKDGHFEIYMVNTATDCFEKVLEYDWEAADGYMYTSDLASMRCGIYGFIDAPLARTLGYQEVGDETGVSAQGIPFDPLWSTTNFPFSGIVRLNDNVYQYYANIAHPSYSIGPAQFRCMGYYDPDDGYGDGYGLDCRQFDWLAGEHIYDDYLVSISSGVNFIISRIDWTIFITTGGETVWLRNRCRIYSTDVLIGKLYHSLANKVWITGGLSGDYSDPDNPVLLNLISGEKASHSEGEFAVYERAGEILCYWYQGTGGEDDTTIGDMVQKVCDLSGAKCQFPSDLVIPTQYISAPTTLLVTDYAEGFDFSFEADPMGTGDDIGILFNAKFNPDNYEEKSTIEDDTDIRIVIRHIGSGEYRYYVYSEPSSYLMYSCMFIANTGYQKFRVMCMKDNIGFYQNGQWVTTIAFDEIVYEKNLELRITIYNPAYNTFKNLRVSDLSDWREAIYIDLETDGTSVLGSIIQQRPIEMFAKPDGSIDFWYDAQRTTVTAGREPIAHNYNHVFPSGGASDAIIYGLKDVKTLQDEDFAREAGFSTKMMRMPDLGIGAMRAAHIILKRLLEGAHKHRVEVRPDLELEPGDIYSFSYEDQNKVPPTRTASIVVEAVSYEFRASETQATARMQIEGREEYEPA